jgi:hypothetical protein
MNEIENNASGCYNCRKGPNPSPYIRDCIICSHRCVSFGKYILGSDDYTARSSMWLPKIEN